MDHRIPQQRLLPFTSLVVGVLLVLSALFADRLGLDHNASWGAGRVGLLSAGALFVALAVCLHYRESRPVTFLWAHHLAIAATLSIVAAFGIYIFFVSGGTWTNWPETTRYYDDLGAAFRAGRLDLNIQPSAELQALRDPYDPSLRNSNPAVRSFVDTVWDLTFYNGKFYVYWGPGPGFLLSIVKLLYSAPVADQYITFAFLAGLLIFSALLILRLRKAFYADLPVSLTVIGLLVAALITPIPWMLNRAAIYEATIASGQFFLIGGTYLAYTAVEQQPPSYWKLLLAGLMWAFAASSRTLMLIPAAFLTFMMILWVATDGLRSPPLRRKLPAQLLLALPLLAGIVAVGWYNWARFGSVLETGLRYTLTFHNLDKFYGESFSPYYALPSLWMFLFNLFTVQRLFPFLVAAVGKSPAFLYLNRPDIYHAEEITGILFCAPFILLALVAIGRAVQRLWRVYVKRSLPRDDRPENLLLWISLCLGGAGLLTFAAIVLYFNLTMRFLAEFLPSLVPLAVLGSWQVYRILQARPVARRAWLGLVAALALVTILVSLLLAFSESHNTVQVYNPHLMRQLIRFFGTH